jgi:hypothetical protein
MEGGMAKPDAPDGSRKPLSAIGFAKTHSRCTLLRKLQINNSNGIVASGVLHAGRKGGQIVEQ